MCGIAGIVVKPPDRVPCGIAAGLARRLLHRGPDDQGVLSFSEGLVRLGREAEYQSPAELWLVHRRLAILDLSEAGWQPMGTRDGRFHLVFNGEVYNFLEIRKELETLGVTFRSRSDTEVLLEGWALWGPEILRRLVGMFAFAVLDQKARKLFLVRDFFGIKPLYYIGYRNGLAFASEIKALLELPGVSRQTNPQRLYDYLRFGITDHDGETLFSDIRQLPAAHFMEISLDHPTPGEPHSFWKVDLAHRLDIPYKEAASQLKSMFLESVRIHLRSDVPVGAALSGGLDSSAIVMAMRCLEPKLEIHAFSYIADDPQLSEARWIDLIAREAGAILHRVTPTPGDLIKDLIKLVTIQDECFGSTSIYAQHCVFQKAHNVGIKVMLDGQGADEILGGYRYFLAARLGSLLRQGQLNKAITFLSHASRLPGSDWLWMVLQTADHLLPAQLQGGLRTLVNRSLVPSWMDHDWLRERNVEMGSPSVRKGRELLRESLHRAMTKTSLPHLLRYEDRNSMAFSIESRVPFLTPNLVSFLFSLPEEYIISPEAETKSIFRRAMQGIVPEAVLSRKDKIGFATPERDWLLQLQAWTDQVLDSEFANSVPVLKSTEMKEDWNGVMIGKNRFDFRVWRWINTIIWTEKLGVEYA